MKTIEKLLRFSLAALLIVVAGDVFFRFIETPEPPPEAQDFLISLTATGYIWPAVGGVFLIGGILLLTKRLIGLALILIFPVTANVALYTIFLDRKAGLGVLLCLLHVIVIWFNRDRFRSLFRL